MELSPEQVGFSRLTLKLHEVTWYSKLAAIFLFVGVVPTLAFYIGIQYQETRDILSVEKITPVIETTDQAVMLNQWFKRDTQHVYEYNGDAGNNSGWQILKGADPSTFTILKRGYAEDIARVYYKNQDGPDFEPTNILDGANPKTFTILSDYYAKDETHVWAIDPGFGGVHELESADPSTFTVIDNTGDGLTAKDAHHTYGPVGPKQFHIDITSSF